MKAHYTQAPPQAPAAEPFMVESRVPMGTSRV